MATKDFIMRETGMSSASADDHIALNRAYLIHQAAKVPNGFWLPEDEAEALAIKLGWIPSR